MSSSCNIKTVKSQWNERAKRPLCVFFFLSGWKFHTFLTTNESYLTTPLIIQLVFNYFTIQCGWEQIFLTNIIEDRVHTKGSVLPLLSQPNTTFEIKKQLLNQINNF